jgi:transcriptional regulator with XRE-family HTH domain
MTTAQDLASKVRVARDVVGLTQADLAVKAGLTRDQIAAIELGKRDINAIELNPLAKALGVRAMHLLGTEDDVQRAPRYRNLSKTGEASELEAFARNFLRREASLRRVVSAE